MSTSTAAVPTATVNPDDNFNNNRSERYWWYSSEAYVVKFAILTGIFVLFVGYFLGGYIHAKRRIKKGLPPLAYHRWLLPRRDRARFDPRYQQPYYNYYQPQDGYAMYNYPPPPPAYNPNAPVPPMYGPPEGGSKVNPTQTPYPYPPPQGPPPPGTGAEAPVEGAAQGNSSSGGFLSRFKRR